MTIGGDRPRAEAEGVLRAPFVTRRRLVEVAEERSLARELRAILPSPLRATKPSCQWNRNEPQGHRI